MSVGVLQNVCVCDGFFGRGPLWSLRKDFVMKWIDMKLHLQLQSIDGQRSGVEKALSCVKSHLVDRPQLAYPRTLPECWLPTATVRGHLQFGSRWNEIWETEVETGRTDVDHESYRGGGAP
jgi:hypothetical protein